MTHFSGFLDMFVESMISFLLPRESQRYGLVPLVPWRASTPEGLVTWNLKMAHSKRRFTFLIIRFYLKLWRCTDVYCNYQLIYVRTLFPKNSCAGVECQQFFLFGKQYDLARSCFFGGGIALIYLAEKSIWLRVQPSFLKTNSWIFLEIPDVEFRLPS